MPYFKLHKLRYASNTAYRATSFPVEPDVGVGFEVVRQLVVDGPDSVGWADSVHIIKECKKGFSFFEVGLDSFQGSSFP